jgi:hypothetical protein
MVINPIVSSVIANLGIPAYRYLHMKTILGRSIAAAAGAALCLLASGLPASAAQQASALPAVKYFRASAKSLPSAGGNVKLSAGVKGGSVCDFTSSPHVRGLPAKISCSHGSARKTVRLPANTAAGQKSYKFGLTVSGHGRKAKAKPVTVVVREAPPSVTQVAVAPADLPSAGGATVLSAIVTRSAKCTVSATPAATGLPVTAACAAGSKAVRVAVPVTLPTLAGATAAETRTHAEGLGRGRHEQRVGVWHCLAGHEVLVTRYSRRPGWLARRCLVCLANVLHGH